MSEVETQRADHFERAYTEASAGRCWASGLSLPECKTTICDCFDFSWVEAAVDCPCGCPALMHVEEIGCPCGLPDEPPCTPHTAHLAAQRPTPAPTEES